jgi:hypothetical protein
MTESTDPNLGTVCAHCGKRFHLRRFVNRFTTFASTEVLGKPAPAKYCSPACRQAHYRVVRTADKTTVAVGAGSTAPVTDLDVPRPILPVTNAPVATRQDDADAFERIRAGRQLSRWEPYANPDPHASGFEIPEFLQRSC